MNRRLATTLATLALAGSLLVAAPAEAATHSACSLAGTNIQECFRVHFAARDGAGIKTTSWRISDGQNGTDCGMFKSPMAVSVRLRFYNANGNRIATRHYSSAFCRQYHALTIKTSTRTLTVRGRYTVHYTSYVEGSRTVTHRVRGHR